MNEYFLRFDIHLVFVIRADRQARIIAPQVVPNRNSDRIAGRFLVPPVIDAERALLKLTVWPGGNARSERKLDLARVNHVAGQGPCAEVLPKGFDR